MNRVRTRFAPSPTGYLHIGGLRTALYAYLFAKQSGGSFILRIEDTDLERHVEGASELIYFTLNDAGLIYDEGPDVGGDYGPYIQSQRRDIYGKYAQVLLENGGAYRCFCSKERLSGLKDKDGQHKYDKKCLRLSPEEISEKLKSGKSYVIRQNIPETGVSSYTDLVYGDISVENKDMEDNILIKSDGMPTYNFANVVDDHLMDINYVIRGTEYLSSTPKYNLLYDSFGWQRPQYIHLPPVMRDERNKLSKRHGDPSYNDLIREGFLKEALLNYIALLGWSPKDNREKFTLSELAENFSLSGISRSSAIFDKQKLRWLNGEYIREMTAAEFTKKALPFYQKSKIAGLYDYQKLSALLLTRTEVFSDIPDMVNFLQEFDNFDSALYVREKLKSDRITALTALKTALPLLRGSEGDFTAHFINEALSGAAAQAGLKKGQMLWAVRIAITGRETTPGGAGEMAELLGKERTIDRLEKSLKNLQQELQQA